MTLELARGETGRARDRFEHLGRDEVDGRNENDLRAALQQREAMRSVVDVEPGSKERGHTGFTIDRPSHEQTWCEPHAGSARGFADRSQRYPTVEPWPYVTRGSHA